MKQKKNPNDDLNPKTFTIGKWKCHPFCFQTAILLERIGSPFMETKTDGEGKVIPTVPKMGEIAETLYVILNWEKPWINEVLADEIRFQNEVGNLASQITMRDFVVITAQLNAMMASLNDAVVESGVPTDGSKKGEIGSTE